ncbi:MAG: hypothetical protein JO302_05730 [Candidatus Eremiobacteraeota bacterium]|nr:hypothetical protein [Candidatus Eremiobacteraeota bacterium]
MDLRRYVTLAFAGALAVSASSCGRGSSLPATAPAQMAPLAADQAVDNPSVLKGLTKQLVIGSTIDPKFGQQNPYGLTVAPATAGAFTAGDLAICNFNDKKNVQGTGYTIVALHAKPGSKPTLVLADKKLLQGCDALALAPDDTIWAADFGANDNPVISSSGKLITNITGKPLNHPFGQIFAAPLHGSPAFYETNAADGTVYRINLGASFTFTKVASGLAVNHGKPGSILGPSGLAYDPKIDTLYVVDGAAGNGVGAVYAIANVSTKPAMHTVFSGPPLSGPISSALLYNGNLVVGNTTNPNGKNLMVELSPKGKVLAMKNVDKGTAGAIFGMVATGTNAANTKLYFNDDNGNNVQVLEK